MNISKHARKRWPERGNPDVAPENIEQEIISAFDRAVIVYEEEEEDGLMQYRVYRDILFVYNLHSDKLITLVNIDFGFSPEINLEICRLQVEKVLYLQKKITEEEAAIKKLCEEIDYRLLAVIGDIAELERKLEAEKAAERRLNQQKIEISKGLEAMRAELANEFSKLKYSIRYRADALKMRHA